MLLGFLSSRVASPTHPRFCLWPMFHRVSTGAALFVILGLATGVASAQETRAEMLEQERAAKAQALATYEPVKLER